LLAGLVNLTLMGLNIRDGLRLTGRIGATMAPTIASGSVPAAGKHNPMTNARSHRSR